eukprot:TRINITY_DN110740_c0_g1_i1.p1 TRINITY_DN110740_c0_g1~~TRINITY_DN110740_c0_g1_i1.p1  ORF type:complete len:374 (+),score=17.93 TRINITY_DN110740_c0_g1_i1:77-1198(+)
MIRFASGGALSCILLGLLAYCVVTLFTCRAVERKKSLHEATEGLVQDVPCGEPAEGVPSSGGVHLVACDVLVPPNGATALFPGFEDIIPPEAAGPYAWTRLRIQHGDARRRRRRAGGKYIWQYVGLDGDLEDEFRLSGGTRMGPFELTDHVIERIPGFKIKLRPPRWQKQISAQPPSPIVNASTWHWIMNSSTMAYAEDCNCVWTGDTRVMIEAATKRPVSALAGAAPGPRMKAWSSSTAGEVISIAEGNRTAKELFLLQLSWSYWDGLGVMVPLSGTLLCALWPPHVDPSDRIWRHVCSCSLCIALCMGGLVTLALATTPWCGVWGHAFVCVLGLAGALLLQNTACKDTRWIDVNDQDHQLLPTAPAAATVE